MVDFICVGAQKSGTTAFYDLIKLHPELELSTKKEVHFFDIDENFAKGIDWYKSFFSSKDILKGEVTPDYMIYGYVPERIYRTLGDKVRLLFILRNPILRAYSQFNFHQMKGVESRRDFEKVIENERLDYENELYNSWYNPTYYLSRGLYYNQIKRFLKYFSIEQMHFQLYEDLFDESKQKECLNEIYDFLGIRTFYPDKIERSNVTKVPVKGIKGELLFKIKESKKFLNSIKKIVPHNLYNKIRFYLIKNIQNQPNKLPKELIFKWNKEYFYDDIKALEDLIKKDCSKWLEKK